MFMGVFNELCRLGVIMFWWFQATLMFRDDIAPSSPDRIAAVAKLFIVSDRVTVPTSAITKEDLGGQCIIEQSLLHATKFTRWWIARYLVC
jgi:hypothetical protein